MSIPMAFALLSCSALRPNPEGGAHALANLGACRQYTWPTGCRGRPGRIGRRRFTLDDQGIPKEEVFHRLDRVKAAASDRGLRGVVAIARPFYERPANVAYLSNHFPPFPTGMYWGEMRGIGHSALVIPSIGDPVLIIDTTYRQDLVPIADVRHARSKTAPPAAFLPDFAEAIVDTLREKDLGSGRVGLAGDDLMPVRMYRDICAGLPGLIFEPFDEVLGRLRMIKSHDELRLHSQAFLEAAASDDGHRGMLLAASTMALAAVTLLHDPVRRAQVRAEFEAGSRR